MSSEIIIRGQISPYRLCLRRPWMTARGGWWYRRGWLICLENGDGRCGYGDCAPWVDLGTETLDQAEKRLRQSIVDVIGVTPATALDTLDSWKGLPAARCGVETALLDLLAQQNGVSIAHWLNPETSPGVAVNSALGRLDDGISVRLHRAIAEGYRVCKIKVGTGTVDEELRRLEELCGSLPEGVGLRLDANRSWDHSTAERMVDALRGLPIESVEDPLAAWDPDALSALQNRATFPLALDEIPVAERCMMDALLADPPVRRLVLKPMVMGGLIPAFSLANQAMKVGMGCVITTTVDSAAGVMAAAHLAAALGDDGVHGLATGEWLSDDLGPGLRVMNGRIRLGMVRGLGFTPAAGIEYIKV